VVRTQRRLINAGDDRRPTRCTNPSGRKGVGVPHTFARQSINVWRDRVFVAKATDMGANILARYPQNVGACGVSLGNMTHQNSGNDHASTEHILESKRHLANDFLHLGSCCEWQKNWLYCETKRAGFDDIQRERSRVHLEVSDLASSL
jgi:signal transduction protein with GAF and PtsI domain